MLGLTAAACGDEGTAGSAAPDSTAASTLATATTEATGATGSTAPATTAPDTSTAPVEAPEILRFSAPLVGGGTFDAATVAGTPLALWFWAPG